MSKIILTVIFMFISTTASAEYWVCYNQSTKRITKSVQGDCLSLGICSGFNNVGLQTNCFEATISQFNKSKNKFVKFENNDVVDMTQSEKDAIILAETNAQEQAKVQRLQVLDNAIDATDMSIILSKADNAINNIGNLADAKAFLRKLVRVIATLHTSDE